MCEMKGRRRLIDSTKQHSIHCNMLKSGLQRMTSGLALMRLCPARQLASHARLGRATINIEVASVLRVPQPYIKTKLHCGVPEVQYVRESDLLREIGGLRTPATSDTASPEGMQLDSVLRKRRKKMKKHKLRKRRRKERAEKRKLSQGR